MHALNCKVIGNCSVCFALKWRARVVDMWSDVIVNKRKIWNIRGLTDVLTVYQKLLFDKTNKMHINSLVERATGWKRLKKT